MNKLIFTFALSLGCVSVLSAKAAKNAGQKAQVKSSDGIITVQPMDNGLHITKNHKSMFTHVDIHVRSVEDGTENYSISTDDKTNKFVYPFVEKGKSYEVYTTMMDSSWGNWTQSKSAVVQAAGGLGNVRTELKGYYYDNSKMSIILDNYKLQKPENVDLLAQTYSGNIYYDQKSEKTDWGRCTWSQYTVQNGIVDISGPAKYFANTEFFIQLESQFMFDGVKYHTTLVSNEKNHFKDVHPLAGVTVSSGILVPPFTPGCTEYTVRGTDKAVILTPEFITPVETSKEIHSVNSENPSHTISFKVDGNTYSYNFIYQQPEIITFDGKNYIQTFYDDFEGTELNGKNWKRSNEEERQSGMKNHGWWSNECSYLDGKGNLIIEAKYKNGQRLSGSVDNQGLFEQSHGYYEIKFKCEKTSGLWYAFWLMGHNDNAHIGKGASDAAEIDVFELVPNEPYNGPNYFKTTIHWDSYGKSHKSKGSPACNPDDSFYDQWHVAQFVWGETSYDFWLDGKLLYQLDASKTDEEHFGGMCNASNWMIISSEFGDWGGAFDETQLPARMYVDYVKAGL